MLTMKSKHLLEWFKSVDILALSHTSSVSINVIIAYWCMDSYMLLVSWLTEEVENVGEERQQAILMSVVDGNAQEVGLGDVRRLRTRRAHIHHVLDTILLHMHWPLIGSV